jgi:hypothetical protein
MWNLIKGILRSGAIIKKLFKTFGVLVVAVIIGATIFSFGVAGLGFLVLVGPSLLTRIVTYLKGEYQDMATVPYWGKQFGFKQIIRLLAEDRMHSYRFNNGKLCRKLKVSESGRWIYVAGRYYPLYLVKEYIREDGSLMMIDGTILKGQHWLYDSEIIEALNEIFCEKELFGVDRGFRTTKMNCETAFLRSWGKDYESLAKADWDKVRYDFEKELKEVEAGRTNAKLRKKLLQKISDPVEARDTMYSRMLLDVEIELIGNAIRSGRLTDLDGWFDMRKFDRDIYVGNGIKILKAAGYPKNAIGTEFLFECISDIEKPYFEDAVQTLQRFPREKLIELIEKYADIAYGNEDVLFGAGLIYLAKKIDYTIKLSDKRQVLAQGQTLKKFT